MGGFLNRLTKVVEQGAKQVEQGAARAQFEADKLMRVNRAKSESESLKAQREKTLAQLGHEALTLILSGQIDHPTLHGLVEQIKGLDIQIKDKEAAVQTIQNEQYAVPVAATPGAGTSQPITPVEPVSPMPPVPPMPPTSAMPPAPTTPMSANPATPPVSTTPPAEGTPGSQM